MIANLKNWKKKKCPFCNQPLISKRSKTCSDPECIVAWRDFKLYERNRLANCEFAIIRGDEIICKKGKFGNAGTYTREGNRYYIPASCINCNQWRDAAEYI